MNTSCLAECDKGCSKICVGCLERVCSKYIRGGKVICYDPIDQEFPSLDYYIDNDKTSIVLCVCCYQGLNYGRNLIVGEAVDVEFYKSKPYFFQSSGMLGVRFAN